jgi:hypothetical protein
MDYQGVVKLRNYFAGKIADISGMLERSDDRSSATYHRRRGELMAYKDIMDKLHESFPGLREKGK